MLLKCIINFHYYFFNYFFSYHIMMENPRPREEKIIKVIRNIFRLKKQVKGIKYIVLRNIMNLSKHEEGENYYKPVRLNNFWSNNYIEYKSNGDKNRIISVKEYLDKIRPYLKDIINDLKKPDTQKTQLKITINFVSSKDNDEECVMHSKRNNIEIMISHDVDEVIKKLFDSLKNRYQNNLQSMRGSKLVFDYVQLLHYKYHQLSLTGSGSYIDSPD